MRKFCLCSLIGTLLFCFPGFSQESKFEDLVAVYVYRFIDFTNWPEEQTLEQIQLAYLGNNQELAASLSNLRSRPVRGKRIDVKTVSNPQDAISGHVILVDEANLSSLRTINALIGRNPKLVVSINARDKQLFGINLLQVGQNLEFEVNRHNLIFQGLKVNKDVVLSGGTEIDIAELLKEMELDLAQNRERLTDITSQLQNSENRLQAQQNQIRQKQRELDDIQQKYLIQQQETDSVRQQYAQMSESLAKTRDALNNSSAQLEQQQQSFNDKTQELQLLTIEVDEKQQKVDQQEAKILEQTNNLKRLEESLVNTQETLDEQTSTISELDETIGKQSFLLFLMLGLFLSVCVTILVIIRWARQKAQLNERLAETVEDLDSTNKRLVATQEQLVDSEKLAALGGIVAGVAHEINTPIGIAVTSSSLLAEKIKNIKEMMESGAVSRNKANKLLNEMDESTVLLCNNIERAKELVYSFKQVSADQISEGKRKINVANYLNEVCRNLQYLLKKKQHNISITCPDELVMNSFPGALSQVITNLVVNSVEHGFEDIKGGEIDILVVVEGDSIIIDYADNGKGIPIEHHKKIFEPFFTSARAKGNTGLGMHICHNLVYQKMGGTIKCREVSQGARFTLQLPREIKDSQSHDA